jgi:hypothetical protein
LYWGASTFDNGMTGKEYAITNVRQRLELLERYSVESNDMAEWKKKLKGLLQMKEESLIPYHWINSEDLRIFFRREKKTYYDKPISAGAELGLYQFIVKDGKFISCIHAIRHLKLI